MYLPVCLICLAVCLHNIFLSTQLSACKHISLPVLTTACLSSQLPACPNNCLPVLTTAYLSSQSQLPACSHICLPVHTSVTLSTHLNGELSIYNTSTKRIVTELSVTKGPVTKRSFTKRPVTELSEYKTSRIQNAQFTKRSISVSV